jgi:predicted HTH domain antitoxin
MKRKTNSEAAMELEIPDIILRQAQLSGHDLYLALAVQLYADNRLDYAQAARLCQLEPALFDRELLRRGVSVQQYPPIGRREAV